jgi:hypothetical protein
LSLITNDFFFISPIVTRLQPPEDNNHFQLCTYIASSHAAFLTHLSIIIPDSKNARVLAIILGYPRQLPIQANHDFYDVSNLTSGELVFISEAAK